MASKNIKGITIEIGGNTTKLENALKDVNKVVYTTNNELKNLNKALKLDPKNTELLAQKQELLQKNIKATTDRLGTLKEAQRQMGDYNKLTEEQKENYRALSVEIAKSENALKQMNGELKKTNSIDLSKVGNALKKVGQIAGEVIKQVGKVVGAVSGAVAGIIAKGVKSYAELEQNIGGVETLFKENADTVIKNAQNAYKTAGVSANEYMKGVTSFSASLLQSTGGDTKKAANIADMAFRDMSDNANKFGTSMESIQNAYQGFAKQNYTMLDNLKLGYGGTKKEMERLLKDAEKLTGKKYDINNLKDVYEAIHEIQNELGVTGTTAEEAEKTISGSANAMKAAFDNFINGSGSPEQLSEALMTFIKNVAGVVEKLAPSILNGLTTLISDLLPKIGSLLIKYLPKLFKEVQKMLKSLFKLISENVQPLANMVLELFNSLVKFILENLPMIVKAAIEIVVALANGIAESLPTLVPVIVDAVLTIVDTLLDNLDLIIDAAIKIIMALTEGLINALPRLIERLPEIIIKLAAGIIKLRMKLIEAGIKLIIALAEGLIKAIPELIKKIPQIISGIVNEFKKQAGKIIEIGKDIVKGIWEGIKSMGDWLKNKIGGFAGGITKNIKKFFGIHSPSTLMRDEIGKNLALGIGEGLEDGIPSIIKDVNSAMSDLNSGIQASVNPTINPTANSNPLIIQIENFNNERASDIQQLAQELEFYRKNSAKARGGN
jgi:phage-related protein